VLRDSLPVVAARRSPQDGSRAARTAGPNLSNWQADASTETRASNTNELAPVVKGSDEYADSIAPGCFFRSRTVAWFPSNRTGDLSAWSPTEDEDEDRAVNYAIVSSARALEISGTWACARNGVGLRVRFTSAVDLATEPFDNSIFAADASGSADYTTSSATEY